MHAQLSRLVHFAQEVWGRMLSSREDDWIEGSKRPFIFDEAMALLMDQTARYMDQTQGRHKLAVRIELTNEDDGMHLHLRGLKTEELVASFTDDVDLLEILTDALTLRSAWRRRAR